MGYCPALQLPDRAVTTLRWYDVKNVHTNATTSTTRLCAPVSNAVENNGGEIATAVAVVVITSSVPAAAVVLVLVRRRRGSPFGLVINGTSSIVVSQYFFLLSSIVVGGLRGRPRTAKPPWKEVVAQRRQRKPSTFFSGGPFFLWGVGRSNRNPKMSTKTSHAPPQHRIDSEDKRRDSSGQDVCAVCFVLCLPGGGAGVEFGGHNHNFSFSFFVQRRRSHS